jgi:hypothetical protein
MSISWTGLIGGALGFAIMNALAIAVAAGAGEASPLNAIPLAALSLIFAFAVYVSVKPFANRETLLKIAVGATMLLAIGGAIAFGAELIVLLAPSLALLAQAAGLIFQGKR